MLTGCWWLRPIILTAWEAEIGRIAIRGQPGQIVGEIYLQNSQSKMAQVEKCLLCKSKALSSNPSPTKRKENIDVTEGRWGIAWLL
jgi:hypothetical protein